MKKQSGLGIACMSGSLKGIFVQGVLTAFERGHFQAETYAACSSSTMPAAHAAIGQVEAMSDAVWMNYKEIVALPGNSMSNVMLSLIDHSLPALIPALFSEQASEFQVACSAVLTQKAAIETQSTDAARQLGRKLLIMGARKNESWRDEHLALHLFTTQPHDTPFAITPTNIREIAYATTRMMHAWHLPSTIDSKPYIDGSYTTMCPATQLAEQGYKKIIAILTEPGSVGLDYFSPQNIPNHHAGAEIDFIQPDIDLKEMGVNFTVATPEALLSVFAYGLEKGERYLKTLG